MMETSGSTSNPEPRVDTAAAPVDSLQDLSQATSARGDSIARDTGMEPLEEAGEVERAIFDRPPAGVGLYIVFTSSHRRERAAEYESGALRDLAVPVVVIPVELQDSGAWYRVAVDAGFGTVTEAAEVLDAVKELGYEGAWIERLRQPTTGVASDE